MDAQPKIGGRACWRVPEIVHPRNSPMLDQNSSAACMERHPVAFTVPIER